MRKNLAPRYEKANFWPNVEQSFLLSAALDEGPQAIDSWEKWQLLGYLPADLKTLSCGDRIDVGSQRLLPLVYHNLLRVGFRDASLNPLKVSYRQTRVHNHFLFHALEQVLSDCNLLGISTMVIKGVALTAATYRDMGLRPMGDLDLVVPANQANPMIELLFKRGWRTRLAHDSIVPNRVPALEFISESGVSLDLHFSIFSNSLENSDTNSIWERAEPLMVGKTPTLAPCVTDQFLHTLSHGLRQSGVPPIRWIADAVSLLRTEAAIDWNSLLVRSSSLGLMMVMQEALPYLSTYFDCIPKEILRQISRYRPSRIERLEFYIWRIKGLSIFGLMHYLRRSNCLGTKSSVLGFLRFIQEKWGMSSMGATLLRIVKRSLVPRKVKVKNLKKWKLRLLEKSVDY